MNVFNAKIRLAGSIGNEVHKWGLTVPELIILRVLHGTDGVVDIQHAGIADIDDIEERERLSTVYDEGLMNLGDDAKTSVSKMFGGDYNPLPSELRGYAGSFSAKDGFLEEFQEVPYVPQEDITMTPLERATARRAKREESRKLSIAQKVAADKVAANKPETKLFKGKTALDAAL